MTRMIAILPLALLAGCQSAPSPPPESEAATAMATLAADGSRFEDGARTLGDVERCIQVAGIGGSPLTQVRSDRVIDFDSNGRIYRNVLPDACPRLGSERRIAYRTTQGRLCVNDPVTVLIAGAGGPGFTCALGSFRQIERTPR